MRFHKGTVCWRKLSWLQAALARRSTMFNGKAWWQIRGNHHLPSSKGWYSFSRTPTSLRLTKKDHLVYKFLLWYPDPWIRGLHYGAQITGLHRSVANHQGAGKTNSCRCLPHQDCSMKAVDALSISCCHGPGSFA